MGGSTASRFYVTLHPMHRTRDRRALIAAIGLSSFGDELAIVALALRVEDLTGSAGMVALLFIVSALPHVLFAPVSGWLTDRRETVQTLRWCSLAQAVVAMAGIVLFAATDNVAEVFFASDTLNQPAIGYGVLASTWMAGMVIGAVLARRADTDRAPIWIFVGAIVGGGALILGAASGALIPAALLFVVAGAGNGVENVAARTLVHGRVPSALHGRVFAAYMGLVSSTQIIATALGGALVVGVGGRQALVIGGLGSLAVGALGLMALALVQAGGAEPPVVLVEDAGEEPRPQIEPADEPREAPA